MIKRIPKVSIKGAIFWSVLLATACSSPDNNKKTMNSPVKGSYGFDVEFFTKHNIKTIELKDPSSEAAVLLIPSLQGRVMTSTTKGSEGNSFGWINYKLFESAEVNSHFNPYGGEERIWLGPEGGPFSIYFKKDAEQVFANWHVPKEIDTESFEIAEQSGTAVTFRKDFSLPNASGTEMKIGIERKVRILNREECESVLNLKINNSLDFVGYESENILTNKGNAEWTKDSGVLSIWLLCMFNPSPNGLVFIPFKQGDEKELGKKVTDDYFGKVPSERLIVKDDVLFFRTDGKHRSKIGISPLRALPFCGSYDPDSHTLTVLWYSSPEKPAQYVNSKWGVQSDPLLGDAVNSYNDGPVDDGSVMGPFYEIESSSPAAFLSPGNQMKHVQRIFHISGDEAGLNEICLKIFKLPLTDTKQAF